MKKLKKKISFRIHKNDINWRLSLRSRNQDRALPNNIDQQIDKETEKIYVNTTKHQYWRVWDEWNFI